MDPKRTNRQQDVSQVDTQYSGDLECQNMHVNVIFMLMGYDKNHCGTTWQIKLVSVVFSPGKKKVSETFVLRRSGLPPVSYKRSIQVPNR